MPLGDAMLAAGWPFRNFYNFYTVAGKPAISPNEKGDYSGVRLRPYHDRLDDYVGIQAGQIPKILIAVLVWNCTVDLQAASQGWDFSPTGWVMTILFRDLFLMIGTI